jgi:hypothetical protein
MNDRRHVRRCWWWLPVLTTIALLWVPSGALAGESAHWHGPVHLGHDRAGIPTSISCATPTACRAVDSQGNATTYDGAWWSPVHDVDGHFGPLAALSCPTTEFCASVGGRRAVTRTAAGWTRLHILPIQRMFAVSCASRHFCLALGALGFAIRYSDTHWAHHHIGAPPHLAALSCVSRTFCLAVTGTGAAYRYDGHRWRHAGEVPAIGSRWSISCATPTFCMVANGTQQVARYHGSGRWTSTRVADGFVPDAVACHGRHFCLAVATAGGVAAAFDGSWATPVVFHEYGEGPTPTSPDRVSCAGGGRCLVVDALGGAFGLDHVWSDVASYPTDRTPAPAVSCLISHICLALDAVGGSWRLSHARHGWVRKHLPDSGSLPPAPRFAAVSCASRKFCVAIDAHEQALTWNGEAWYALHTLPPGRWSDLACAKPRFCMAVDADGEGASFVLTTDGATWTDAGAVTLSHVGALDCATAGQCWAGGESGDVSRYDEGTGWSVPQTIATSFDGDGHDRLSWMSCWSLSCAVHDEFGNVYRTTDPDTWGAPEHVAGLGPMSCPSTSICTAVDARRTGDVRRFRADAWRDPVRIVPVGYSSTITGLSCPTTRFCVAVDTNGNAFVRR